MPTKRAQAETIKEDARTGLRAMLPPGSEVWTVIRATTMGRNGNTNRRITLIVVRNGEPIDITWRVALALGEKMYEGGIRAYGDAELIHTLSYALHGIPMDGNPDSGYTLSARRLIS